MQSTRLIYRNIKQWKFISKSSCIANQSTQTSQIQESLSIPQPEGTTKLLSPKIEKLVLNIVELNLLEVAELNDALKKTLNLSDLPVMSMGFPAAQPSKEDEEAEAPQKVQTSFTVKLLKYDDKQKVPLIKEVKNLLEGMNLVQAKKFVESAPTVVKADISKEEAEKLKEALSKVGAEIDIL